MLWPKKNSYKGFDNEKKFLRLENSPPPPITFQMVRPLKIQNPPETVNPQISVCFRLRGRRYQDIADLIFYLFQFF